MVWICRLLRPWDTYRTLFLWEKSTYEFLKNSCEKSTIYVSHLSDFSQKIPKPFLCNNFLRIRILIKLAHIYPLFFSIENKSSICAGHLLPAQWSSQLPNWTPSTRGPAFAPSPFVSYGPRPNWAPPHPSLLGPAGCYTCNDNQHTQATCPHCYVGPDSFSPFAIRFLPNPTLIQKTMGTLNEGFPFLANAYSCQWKVTRRIDNRHMKQPLKKNGGIQAKGRKKFFS